jgi:hypothetical protein
MSYLKSKTMRGKEALAANAVKGLNIRFSSEKALKETISKANFVFIENPVK